MDTFEDRSTLTDEEKEFYDLFKSKGYDIYSLTFAKHEGSGYLGVTLDNVLFSRDERVTQKGMRFSPNGFAVHYFIDCISVEELSKMLVRD